MKQTHRCPKCGSTALYHVPPSEWIYSRGINIYTGLHKGGRILAERYLCTDCGYLELWAARPEDLAELKKRL